MLRGSPTEANFKLHTRFKTHAASGNRECFHDNVGPDQGQNSFHLRRPGAMPCRNHHEGILPALLVRNVRRQGTHRDEVVIVDHRGGSQVAIDELSVLFLDRDQGRSLA